MADSCLIGGAACIWSRRSPWWLGMRCGSRAVGSRRMYCCSHRRHRHIGLGSGHCLPADRHLTAQRLAARGAGNGNPVALTSVRIICCIKVMQGYWKQRFLPTHTIFIKRTITYPTGPLWDRIEIAKPKIFINPQSIISHLLPVPMMSYLINFPFMIQ